jgi:hypothetical protein
MFIIKFYEINRPLRYIHSNHAVLSADEANLKVQSAGLNPP